MRARAHLQRGDSARCGSSQTPRCFCVWIVFCVLQLALHERAELCALSNYLGFDLCGSRALWPIYIDLHWWAQPKHLVLLLLDASIPIGAVLGSAYRVDVCPVILQRRDSIGLDLKDNHALLCSGPTNLTVSGRGLLAHGLVWPWGGKLDVTYYTVYNHGINGLILFISFMISRMPYSCSNGGWVILAGILYLGFSLMQFAGVLSKPARATRTSGTVPSMSSSTGTNH